MKKKEFIAKYGKEAYVKMILQGRERQRAWGERNPQKVIELCRKRNRKGGKYYEKHLIENRTGLRGERNKIRGEHRKHWRPYKNIIAPDSQLHHQWCPRTAEYTGLALVEADQHIHGIIDVIQILEGEITSLTEKDVRMGNKV